MRARRQVFGNMVNLIGWQKFMAINTWFTNLFDLMRLPAIAACDGEFVANRRGSRFLINACARNLTAAAVAIQIVELVQRAAILEPQIGAFANGQRKSQGAQNSGKKPPEQFAADARGDPGPAHFKPGIQRFYRRFSESSPYPRESFPNS